MQQNIFANVAGSHNSNNSSNSNSSSSNYSYCNMQHMLGNMAKAGVAAATILGVKGSELAVQRAQSLETRTTLRQQQ